MYIRMVDEDEATGRLAESYAAARERAGKVYNILKAMSISPAALDASMGLYIELMFGEGPLSRPLREMIAVTVSRANQCHY